MTPEQNTIIDLRCKLRSWRGIAVCFLGVVALLCVREAIGQPAWINSPAQSVAIAYADALALEQIDPVLPIATRYVAFNTPVVIQVQQGDQEIQVDGTRAAVSLAANTAMLHAAQPWRATHCGEGVYRLDLAAYADHNERRLRLLLDTWERQTDQQFYLPTDNFKTVHSPRYFHAGTGKVWEGVKIRVVIPAVHADIDQRLTSLCTMTQSAVPIISAGQFFRFCLNSDFGGLYPEFRQFDQRPNGQTFEEAFLARAGVDLKKLGDNNSDQRVVLLRKPTANVGTVEYVPAAITRPSVGPTIATITRDYFSGAEVGQDEHPFENLLGQKHDGSEYFLPTAAGGLEYALADGDGNFVRSAPLNPPNSLAADRTINPPFMPILQGPSGCIRCHVQTNPDTTRLTIYQDAPNWITWLRNTEVDGWRFDVFADGKGFDEDLNRLVSLYSGETAEAFAYAGRTYAKFVFEASGLPFEQSVKAMMQCHDDWLFVYKEPQDVMALMGHWCEDNAAAVELFNDLVPPAPEPLRVSFIRAWTPERQTRMTVDDALALYPEIALRAMVNNPFQAKPKPPVPTDQ